MNLNGQYIFLSMRNKAQVLIISLWILAILALLSVSIAHRVSLGLRLSRYQKERLKAAYLAKAGINIAIAEIEKDKNEFSADTKVVDEESKIDINTAPQELLSELLNTMGAANPLELANNICAWRGDTGVAIPDYQVLGYGNKGKKFSNIEELMLVKDFTGDIYNSIKEFVTVYPQDGESRININTAPRTVLEILMNTYVKRLQERNIPIENPQGLLEAIINFRNNGGIFTDENIDSILEKLSAEQKNILNDPVDGLKNKITVKSDYFLIVSEGKINTVKLKHVIECVFDRQNNKIVFWHEN